jgi:hypothetical protein
MRLEGRIVSGPSGIEWRVGRRWLSRGLPRWRKVRIGGDAGREGAAEAAAWSIPDLGSLDDLGAAIAIVVGLIVLAVVLVPLLLFGIELIIAGLVIAVGVVGRGLLGRPWVVQAAPADDRARAQAWRVVGWRRSGRLIDEVTASLAAGLEPAPVEPAEVILTGATAPVPAEGEVR